MCFLKSALRNTDWGPYAKLRWEVRKMVRWSKKSESTRVHAWWSSRQPDKRNCEVQSVGTRSFDAVFVAVASYLKKKKKRLHFWVWKLKQLEALQARLIWRVTYSGCSVINSFSAPRLSRKKALEVLPRCPIWYRNKWQILCFQLKIGDRLWFLRSLLHSVTVPLWELDIWDNWEL